MVIWFLWALAVGGISEAWNPPSGLNLVYSNDCERTFLEGEGVSQSQVNCMAGQKLGLYSAKYTYYVYRGPRDGNLNSGGGSSYYPGNICGLRNLLRFNCSLAQRPVFGLAARSEGSFTTPIRLGAHPDQSEPVLVGFAAPLGRDGKCEKGLIKVRPFLAVPPSQVDPLPTNFINQNGSLNNTRIADASSRQDPMKLFRVPNSVPCDRNGRCQLPSGSPQLKATVDFMAYSPVVCVLPVN